LDDELKPHLPLIYKQLDLDGATKNSVTSRLTAITLLTYLPPEHTIPASKKLEFDLKHSRWEVKLAAADALLRTNPKNKTPIAKAMAEVLTVPKLPSDFLYDRVFHDILSMGADSKAAIPTLRIAQTKANANVKAKILLLMVALDPDQKEFAISSARMMQQAGNDSYSRAAVLMQLGAMSSEETMRILNDGLDSVRTDTHSARAIEILGPKAKSLMPKLEAILNNPKTLNPLVMVVALRTIDGDSKLMLNRLLNHAREFPKEGARIAVVCNRFGIEVRPILPELFQILSNDQGLSSDFVEAVCRIDPRLSRKSNQLSN
jgi:hypothetical protein